MAVEQPLRSLIPSDWKRALGAADSQTPFAELEELLAAEKRRGANVFPPRARIFSALTNTPLNETAVVIVGQDPYPTAGNANGLSFSVERGMKIPPSLKNIFKGLMADVGIAAPTSGDLTPWAKQGVLLLNTVLTVREGEANSHQGKGWEKVTHAILQAVNATEGPVVFLCFGIKAQSMVADLVNPQKHAVLTAPHPSPLNGRKFVEAVSTGRHFTKANEILRAAGRREVDWQIP